ncbi:MAG: LON peptidase substrate-binding domain-containing protein, partial [Prevotella sp.]|nr:LON peptidase substrate-binding domain-containing protein [Prevotella sp.]
MKQIINNNQSIEKDNAFYTVTMRGLVAFPDMIMHFDVARKKTIKSIESAMAEGNGRLFLITQKDPYTDNPEISDLYKTGVVAEIKQVLRLPDNIMKVLVKGVYKANLLGFNDDGETLVSEVKRVSSHSKQKYDETEIEALMRVI